MSTCHPFVPSLWMASPCPCMVNHVTSFWPPQEGREGPERRAGLRPQDRLPFPGRSFPPPAAEAPELCQWPVNHISLRWHWTAPHGESGILDFKGPWWWFPSLWLSECPSPELNKTKQNQKTTHTHTHTHTHQNPPKADGVMTGPSTLSLPGHSRNVKGLSPCWQF